MKRSTDRILTTHVGSLPRPDALLAKLAQRHEGIPYEQTLLEKSVADIVSKQAELGIDIVSDGEMSKPSFLTYVNERLSGFEPAPAGGRSGQNPWAHSKDAVSFPDYYGAGGGSVPVPPSKVCSGPITYVGHKYLQTDISNLKAALRAVKAEEAFIPAISISSVAEWQMNRYYRTEEEYLLAIADAMREEYKMIVDAGFVLQVDDPFLATYYMSKPDVTIEQARKWAERRIEIVNHALEGIPTERIRFHTCYSINMGPRVHDMELKDYVDLMLRIRAGAYSFEYGNPRHEHEWRVWQEIKLPDDKILIPGFISHSTVLVEHPELVAERILRFAQVVGRERVIAGADCGFASQAASKEIAPSIVWAKLKSLAEGARIASRQLWPRA